MSEWRRKKAMREKIRARSRAAKEALLSPTRGKLMRRKELDTRAASRKQRTPFIFPAGSQREQREAIYAAADWKAHSTKLAPLQFTSTPPRVSSLTRAKTQRVPFSKFKKICAQRARVNMDNIWVAIPVAHQAAAAAAAAAASSSPDRSPGGYHRRKKFLETQYDWVPASLLRHHYYQPQYQAEEEEEGGQQDERGRRPAAMELLVPPRPFAS